MNRRTLLARFAAIAAAVTLAPAVKAEADEAATVGCVECERLRSHPVPLPDAFVRTEAIDSAVIEMAHAAALRDSVSHRAAAAMLYPQFFPSVETVQATGPLMVEAGPWGSRVVGPQPEFLRHIKSDPPTFEAMQQDCAARGCHLGRVGAGSEPWGDLAIVHGDHPRYERFAFEGRGPLTPTGLAHVDAWRRDLHDLT